MAEVPHDLDATEVERLTSGGVTHLLVDHRLRQQVSTSELAIFPGAFNPLHTAHRQIAALAEERLKRRVAFEISVENVDKATLTAAEIQRRVRQFAATDIVCLTLASIFTEKARLFEDACFLVGADTIKRIADARYYDDQPDRRDQAIADIAECGCSFLVFGRLLDGTFRTLDELDLPKPLREICDGLGEEAFRMDVSSTERRESNPSR